MTFLFVCIATLFVVPLALGQDATLAAEYSSFKQLVSPSYELYWNFDAATQNLSIAVRVQTTGYIGFGISPNGGMPNSDVVIGWVAGGMTCFHDRKVPNAQTLPKIDDEQNWFLIEGTEDNGWTTLKFWRLLDTGDSSEDIVIGEGQTRLIYSWNDNEPGDCASDPLYHSTNRGINGAVFVETDEVKNDLKDAESLLLLQDDITIPSDTTTYWCVGFKLPEKITSQKKHMIRYAPVVHPEAAAHVHHMLLYECPPVANTVIENNGTDLNGGPCSTTPLGNCRAGTILAAWAVGGQPFNFPSDVSFSFGGPDASSYWVIEMHYDNPGSVAGVKDQSGFNISYINEGRKYDAGLLEVGHRVGPDMYVPPGLSRFIITGTCDPFCTADSDIGFCQELTVYANFLHTHLAGVALTLKIIRGNEEFILDQELNYDFNFQDARIIKGTLKPGDKLELECVYQTENKSNTLQGGLATTDEMCLSFLNYYPRIPLLRCLSYPTETTTATFYNGLSTEKQNELDSLSNLADPSAILAAFTWDVDSIRALENAYRTDYNPNCGSIPNTDCDFFKDKENGGRRTVAQAVAVLLAFVLVLLA